MAEMTMAYRDAKRLENTIRDDLDPELWGGELGLYGINEERLSVCLTWGGTDYWLESPAEWQQWRKRHPRAGRNEPSQPGRVTIALGAWLALVVAAVAVTLCVFGAAWITDLWTLGLAVGGR